MSTIDELIQRLRTAEIGKSTPTLDALTRIGAPAIPALLAVLLTKDDNWRAWSRAATVLSRIGPDAVPALVEAAVNSKAGPAFAGLRDMGPPAVPALLELLRHEKERVRLCAAGALVRAGQAAVPALVERATDEREVDTVRSAARITLERIAPGFGGMLS